MDDKDENLENETESDDFDANREIESYYKDQREYFDSDSDFEESQDSASHGDL